MIMVILWAGTAVEATYSGGTGESSDPYRIATAADLNDIGNHSEDFNKHFVLVNDVDLAGYTGTQFNIIGNSTTPFTGQFDGKGYKIYNFNWFSAAQNDIGIFGYTSAGAGSGCQIKNITLENINVSAGTGSNVGALVGNNSATIINCSSSGTISGKSSVGGLLGVNSTGHVFGCSATVVVTGGGDSTAVGGLIGNNYTGYVYNCHCTANVSGKYKVGGLAGQNSGFGFIYDSSASSTVNGTAAIGGLVGECYNDAEVVACYSTGSVTGGERVGGLVGYNALANQIENCYSNATVTASSYYAGGLVGWSTSSRSITNCYSTGSVTGYSIYFGGLVGENSGVAVENSFWDIEPSGCDTSDGGIPKTTSEMKTKTTFTDAGWDFVNETANGTNDYWRMCVDGVEYPLLSWQFVGDFICPDGVDILDFAFFVERWLAMCEENNNFCNCTDINHDWLVDFRDFAIFASHWLEGM
jgi:hypothetical protein